MRASSLFPLLALATSVLLLVDVASAAKTKSGSKDDSAGVDKETVQMMMDRLEQVSGVFTGGHKPRASTRGERAGWVLVDDEKLTREWGTCSCDAWNPFGCLLAVGTVELDVRTARGVAGRRQPMWDRAVVGCRPSATKGARELGLWVVARGAQPWP